MKNKHFSTAVTAGCIIAPIVLIAVIKCSGQSKQGFRFNNADYFADAPKLKALDWSTYMESVDGKQITIWSIYAGAGVAFGMREAYHARPDCFERHWGVEKTSFWGSNAWMRNYVGSNPDNPHKHEFFGNVGRDVWHTAGLTSKVMMFSGTFAITQRKHPVKYKILNALVGYGIQSVFCSLTYNSLRS